MSNNAIELLLFSKNKKCCCNRTTQTDTVIITVFTFDSDVAQVFVRKQEYALNSERQFRGALL